MITRLAAHAMGTRFEIALAGLDEWSLRAAGETAIAEILDWDAKLSLFRRDSLLSHINRTAAEQPVRLDGETFALIAAAMEVHGLMLGAFDITLAPLMRVWRFHGEDSSAAASDDDAEPVTGMDLIELDPGASTIRFKRTGVSLDLGGIAKGHGLFCAAEVLRLAGVGCALLHGGTSSITAIGAPPGEEGWRVRIGDEEGAPVVVMRDVSMSVSSPRGRTVEGRGGGKLGHILDPRTRRPMPVGASLAAAIDVSPVLAEGVSTGLIVLGRRPRELPERVTTVLRGEDGEWSVEGEGAAMVRFDEAAHLSCVE